VGVRSEAETAFLSCDGQKCSEAHRFCTQRFCREIFAFFPARLKGLSSNDDGWPRWSGCTHRTHGSTHHTGARTHMGARTHTGSHTLKCTVHTCTHAHRRENLTQSREKPRPLNKKINAINISVIEKKLMH